MRLIYVSPHLDDAVLSAGGLIFDQARAGRRVEIWTVVCGFPPDGPLTPFAQVLHFRWGFASAEETVRMRRAEDQRAAAIVGAKAVHFDFPDCIYRRDADGEPLYPAGVFAAPHPADADLAGQMTSALAARLEPDDRLFCPLTIGGHVDHVLVRKAVEGLERPLLYFADIPYLLNAPEALTRFSDGGRPEVQKVSKDGVQAWVEGIAAYTSQIPTLFDSVDAIREKIENYAQNGLKLWKFERGLLENRPNP